MNKERIVFSKKYILIQNSDDYVVVDTGSPLSYHRSGQLSFGGTINKCQTRIFGVDGNALSDEVGLTVAGLLGMDIIGKFNNVSFDYANSQIMVDDEELENLDVIPLPSGSFMGLTYIDILVEERNARVFVDTGAPISYISDAYTHGLPPKESLSDYNPAFGRFTTDIFEVNVSIGPNTHFMPMGNLPTAFQMALNLANVDGVIGYEMFSRHKLLYQNKQWHICPDI